MEWQTEIVWSMVVTFATYVLKSSTQGRTQANILAGKNQALIKSHPQKRDHQKQQKELTLRRREPIRQCPKSKKLSAEKIRLSYSQEQN